MQGDVACLEDVLGLALPPTVPVPTPLLPLVILPLLLLPSVNPGTHSRCRQPLTLCRAWWTVMTPCRRLLSCPLALLPSSTAATTPTTSPSSHPARPPLLAPVDPLPPTQPLSSHRLSLPRFPQKSLLFQYLQPQGTLPMIQFLHQRHFLTPLLIPPTLRHPVELTQCVSPTQACWARLSLRPARL
jgi:hypothetical protein